MIMFKKIDVHQMMVFLGLSLLVLWFVGNFYWGERLYVGEGTAWDSDLYAEMALNIETYLSQKTLSAYYIKRILPSTIVHYGAKIFCFPLSIPQQHHKEVISAFYIYNSILLIIAFFFFWRIANHFNWSLQIRFIAFSALFLNFPVLKYSTYSVVLTDPTSLVLGIGLFCFFIKRNQSGVFLITLLGSFSWPSFIYFGAVLLCFPVQPTNSKYNRPKQSIYLNHILNVIPTLAVAGLIFNLLEAGFTTPCASSCNVINFFLLPLSILATSLFIYLATRPFIEYQYYLLYLRSQISFVSVTVVVALWAFVEYMTMLFSANSTFITPVFLLDQTVLSSVVNPLGFLVAHTFYFGPLVLLLIFLWDDFATLVKSYGVGLVLLILLGLALGMNAQSRLAINLWPFFALFLSEVLNKQFKVTWCFTYTMVVMSLVLSKFWFQINVPSMNVGTFLEFPQQRYFLNFGPWMSNEMYYVHLVAVLCIATVLYCLLKTLPKKI